MADTRINKDGQPRKPKESAHANLDRIWAQAWADMQKQREERRRCVEAMLRAGLAHEGGR